MPRIARLVLPAVAFSLVVAACGGAAKGADTASASAPAVDVAKEEQAVRARAAELLAAVQKKDTAAIGAFYAASGLFMAPGMQAMRGPDGAKKGWRPTLEARGASMHFEPTMVNVAAAGDMAYEVGTYNVTAPGGGDRGKYVVVWQKFGDEWKIAADIFNSDGAAR